MTKSFEMVGGALVAVNAHLHLLSESERKVGEYICKEPKKALHYNVRELAKQSNSSQAAVIRFCKRTGFENFSNFKLRLARDVFRDSDDRYIPDLDLESEANPSRVIHGIVDRMQRSLSSLEATLDPQSVEKAVSLLSTSTSINLFGVGASGVVAYDFMQKLTRLGLSVFYTSDSDLQLTKASTMNRSQVAFVISYSGENKNMIEVVEIAKDRSVPVISLTMDIRNTVRNSASIALLIPSTEKIYRPGATTSRINQLTVIDILYSLMVSHNLDDSITALETTMEATHREKK
ncbi:MAG: MurR/RpiR family transcriptional regulator [Sphaerochaeta sp.]|nr:MurR/RpiR family transcriptional regulator [Sphaerochaeta sp.]